MSICYGCGKLLTDGVGRPVEGVSREIDGSPVQLHKVCAQTFDADMVRVSSSPMEWDRDPRRDGGGWARGIEVNIDTYEGMTQAKAWTAGMLSVMNRQAVWAVPRSGSIYHIDKDAMTVKRESGEDCIDRVFKELGYMVMPCK